MIKLTLLIIISVSVFTPATGQTQAELTAEARTEFLVSEKKMNTVLSDIKRKFEGDTVFLKNLDAAQEQWMNLRQLELAMRFPEREPGYYGSAHRMCLNLYLTELNNQRISHLQKWLEGDSDGDICAGSVSEGK